MSLILIGLVLILVLTTLRAIKVKSFKTHLIIDIIIFSLMFTVVFLKKFAIGMVICLTILILWIFIGALVRKFYSNFDFWFMNKMCKLFKLPQYKSIEDLDKDSTYATRFSTELYYYAVEVGICVLMVFI